MIKTAVLFLFTLAAAFGQSAGITNVTVSFSATPTFTTTAGITNFDVTLTGNVTSSTFSSAAVGNGSVNVCQDGTGGRTLVWPTNFVGFPTIASAASACTRVHWKYDGTNVTATTSAITGNAGTATALAATPTPCSAGSAPRGIAASGNANNCTAYAAGYATVTFSATPTFDASTSTTGAAFLITLTGNVTSSTLSGASTGEILTFRVCQDGTGSRTFVAPTNVLNMGTISATASACSNQTFVYDGTNAQALGVMFVTGTTGSSITLPGSTSGSTVLQPSATASGTLTLPAATDTLVGKGTTDTLTNKTYDTAGTGNSFSINGVAATANTGTGAVARAASPTFTGPTLGVALATSLNGLTVTTSTGTLTVPNGVVLTGPASSGTVAAVNQANTATSAMTLDMSAASATAGLKTPVAAGAAPTANGAVAYDSTNNLQKFGANGSTKTTASRSGTLTNGNCVSINATGDFVDAGGACTTGGGGGTVTSSTGGQFAWFPTTGTTVAGSSVLTDNGTNLGTTEPFSLGANYLSTTQVAGTGGTTAGLLVKIDSATPSANVITIATSDTEVLGIATSTQSSSANVEVATRGIVNCVADNSTTIGHLLGVGTTTAGRCKDLGQTSTSSVDLTLRIIGRARTAVAAGSNVSVQLFGPGHSGAGAPVTSVSPFTGATALTGAVNFGLHATNAKTATYQVLAADFASCKTIPVASGTFTITLVDTATQPGDGQCVLIVNYGSGTVTVARSGQNINGAASNLTLAAGSASAPNGVYVFSNGTNYFAQPFGAGGSGLSTSDAVVAIGNPSDAANSRSLVSGLGTTMTDGGANSTVKVDVNPFDASIVYEWEEFLGGGNNTDTAGQLGKLGWHKNSGCAADQEGFIAAVANHPGIWQEGTTTTANGTCNTTLNPGNLNHLPVMSTTTNWRADFIFQNPNADLTSQNMWAGFISDQTAYPPANGWYLKFNSATSCSGGTGDSTTNFVFVNIAGSTETCIDSGVAAAVGTSTTNWFRVKIYSTTAGTVNFAISTDGGAFSTVKCFNSGGTGGCTAATLPTVALTPTFGVKTLTTARRNIRMDWFGILFQGLTR